MEEHIANIGISLGIFWFFAISIFFCILTFFRVFGSLRTSLLCIKWELAGGGSAAVAVAVGVSDR